MSRPRILVDAFSVSEGGGRSYVMNLLRELARDDRGFDFTFLSHPGQLDGFETTGVRLAPVRVPELGGRVAWRVLYEELLMPFRALRYDLLYSLADLSPAVAWTPTVVLLRNLNIYDRRWYDDARTRTLNRLCRLGVPRARRVLFPSQAAADQICELMPVPTDRVRVVPYGIDPTAFDDPIDREHAGRRYVFLAAAIERHKNIAVLIEALPHVADRELEVWVAGQSLLDPAHQRELEQRAEALGVRDRIRFLGAVPYREVLGYYRGAAAFVFPSFIETFGHPLLEAMTMGAPVVASDIPAFREIAADAALYFPPTDAGALARTLDRIDAEPEATAHRVALGHRRVAEYTWKRSVDVLCHVFEEVLAEDRAA